MTDQPSSSSSSTLAQPQSLTRHESESTSLPPSPPLDVSLEGILRRQNEAGVEVARDSEAAVTAWHPLSSTPLGPHPVSPPKRPPPAVFPSDPGSRVQSQSKSYIKDSAHAHRASSVSPSRAEGVGSAEQPRLAPGVGLGFGLPQSRRTTLDKEQQQQDNEEQRKVINPSFSSSSSSSKQPAASSSTPAAASPSLAPPRPAAAAWRNMPGFEELSESWEPTPAEAPSQGGETRASSESRHTGETGSTVRPSPPSSQSVSATDPQGSLGTRSQNEQAQDVLRAGPTNASLRIPSHTALASRSMARARSTSSTETQSFRDALGSSAFGPASSREHGAAQRSEVEALAEAPRSPSEAPSSSSSSSGAKAGSRAPESQIFDSVSSSVAGHDDESIVGVSPTAPFEARASHNTFGTARSPPPELQAQVDALHQHSEVGEATFVEISGAEDLPPILKPAWARPGAAAKVAKAEHMFTPLKLQSMFKTPSPPVRSSEPSNSDAAVAAATPAPTATAATPNVPARRVPSTTFTFASPQEAPKVHFPSTFSNTAPTTPRVQVQPSTPARRLAPGAAAGTPRTGGRTPRAPHLPLRLFRTGTSKDQAVSRPLFSNAAAPPLALRAQRGESEEADEAKRETKRLRLALPPNGIELEQGECSSASISPLSEAAQQNEMHRDLPISPPRALPTATTGQSASLRSGQRRDYVSEAPDFLARCRDVPFSSDGSLTGEAEEDEPIWRENQVQSRAQAQAQSQAPDGATGTATDPLRLSQRRLPGGEARARRAMLGSGEWEQRHLHAQTQSLYRSPAQHRAASAGPASFRSDFASGLGEEEESPRKLLRLINAVATAEAEVQAEELEHSPKRRERMGSEEAAQARRDDEMRALEERLRHNALARRAQEEAQLAALQREIGAEPTAHVRRKTSMLHIRPDELPSDLEKLGSGRMTFDSESMRWVPRRSSRRTSDSATATSAGATTSTVASTAPATGAARATLAGSTIAEVSRETLTRVPLLEDLGSGSGDSTDPFKDIESFGTTRDAPTPPALPASHSATVFSFGVAPPTAQRASTSIEGRRGSLPPSALLPASRLAAAAAIPRSGSTLRNEIDLFSDGGSTVQSSHATGTQRSIADPVSPRVALRNSLDAIQAAAEAAPHISPSIVATPIRGVTTPRNATPLAHLQPPRSILKSAAPMTQALDERSFRGANEARSISFADGRLAGPLLLQQHEQDAEAEASMLERDERLVDLLEQVRELALLPSSSSSSSATAAGRVGHLGAGIGEESAHSAWSDVTPRQHNRRSLRRRELGSSSVPRSPWNITALRARRARADAGTDAEMTFLTDASFGVAHDRILELISDVAPWEPRWKELRSIDLSGRRVESVVRIKEFLPNLEDVKLDHNEMAYLTGLPPSVRVLDVSYNALPPTISFGHLLNLETLDISHNDIGSLQALSNLRHLRQLRADYIGLVSIAGIERHSGLMTLSLKGNTLKALNLLEVDWVHLEHLSVAHNALLSIRGLGIMHHLRTLNVEHNSLARLELGQSLPKLRVLRVSGNAALDHLSVAAAPGLRTLYADFCALEEVGGLETCARLDNLSLRQQVGGEGLLYPAQRSSEVRRLFLSGNLMPLGLYNGTRLTASSSGGMAQVRFFNLVYLELSGCQLTTLPANLPSLAPNMRHLNADHNLFARLPSLQGMTRLKRLSIVGCRIKRSRNLIDALRDHNELEVLDTRSNPCTLGLYPPVLLTTASPQGHARTTFSAAEPQLLSSSALPPFPNPAIVQPDAAHAAARQVRRAAKQAQRAAEMSYFHKRAPAPRLGLSSTDDEAEEEEDETASTMGGGAAQGVSATALGSAAAVVVASDARFVRTLPPTFKERRLLHRGTLAMACPALTWLDGLRIDEEEVLEADRRLTREAEFLQATNASAVEGRGDDRAGHERRSPDARERVREGSDVWTP